MAALRSLLARARLSAIVLRSTRSNELVNRSRPLLVDQVQKRWGSYKASPMYEDPSQYTDYDITKDPQEWEYVERLLKPKAVPQPPLENKSYASGWKPPACKPGDHPYYIQRSRNYMLPVYMKITFRGMRRVTVIRKINGDIWSLESELKKYLEEKTNKKVGVRVNELIGEIQLRGDYVTHVRTWMDAKGF